MSRIVTRATPSGPVEVVRLGDRLTRMVEMGWAEQGAERRVGER
ncbi:hypothetical protein [Streptomyces cavernae]|nr:hypothetical protein [Streptomyces cavernae]